MNTLAAEIPVTPGDPDAPAMKERATLHDLIARRHPSPEWATVFECANRTGANERYADALALNLWSSRGHVLIGFEVKVSRNDWRRELKNPKKSDAIQSFCDRWYIVTEPGIVLPGELPETWGLLERATNGRGLTIAKEAPKLPAEPFTRGFVAAFCRRAAEGVDKLVDIRLREERAAMRKASNEDIEREVARRTRRATEVMERLRQIKAQCGIDFMARYCGPSAAQIELAQKVFGEYGVMRDMNRLASELEALSGLIRDVAAKTNLQPCSEDPR